MQKSKIKLLIADDSSVFRQILIDFFDGSDDIEIIGVAENGADAFKAIQTKLPDVVVLDILMPIHDGLWVLEELQAHGLDKIVKPIVVTAIDSDNIAKSAMYSGACYYMIKPFSLEVLERRIRQVMDYNLVQKINKSFDKEKVKPEPPALDIVSDDIECTITEILSKMFISASIKGYHYLRKAILMAVEDESVLVGITKGLYPDIAKIYDTSSSKVERAIRHAIESSWKKGGQEFYNKIMGYEVSEKPTNGHMIANLAEYIRIHRK